MKSLCSVLGRLYDKVNTHYQDEGRAMPVPKCAFLFAGDNRVGIFDARKMKDVDNRTFLYAAFLCLFSAIPGEEAESQWDDAIKTLPSAIFQRKVLCALRTTQAARKCGGSIIGLEAVFRRAERCEAKGRN